MFFTAKFSVELNGHITHYYVHLAQIIKMWKREERTAAKTNSFMLSRARRDKHERKCGKVGEIQCVYSELGWCLCA